MTKKLFSLFILSAMVLSLFSLVSCSKKDQDNFSRMTVDINPSIEFMLDSENKVAAVTALNDDGSLLIAGEAFVGKTAEDAAELVITLATETGYLVKGNVEATENTVKISVSGDTRQAEKLKNAVVGQVESALAELDIQGKVEKVEAMKIEGLRQLALSTSLYTEEDINAEYQRIADAYNMPVDQVKESLPADAITEDMRVKKAMDLVREKAVVTDVAPEEKKTEEEA